jgi:hypothetical protein
MKRHSWIAIKLSERADIDQLEAADRKKSGRESTGSCFNAIRLSNDVKDFSVQSTDVPQNGCLLIRLNPIRLPFFFIRFLLLPFFGSLSSRLLLVIRTIFIRISVVRAT